VPEPFDDAIGLLVLLRKDHSHFSLVPHGFSPNASRRQEKQLSKLQKIGKNGGSNFDRSFNTWPSP